MGPCGLRALRTLVGGLTTLYTTVAARGTAEPKGEAAAATGPSDVFVIYV